jgi:hypothetical protein
MALDTLQGLTRRLFAADTIINWIIAGALLLFPTCVEGLLAGGALLPKAVYAALGAGFLIFAIWQTVVIWRRTVIERGVMGFAALMALLPAILLAAALCFATLSLRRWAGAALWAAVAYMLLLGSLYAHVYRTLTSRQR